jgi:hypothetical protein
MSAHFKQKLPERKQADNMRAIGQLWQRLEDDQRRFLQEHSDSLCENEEFIQEICALLGSKEVQEATADGDEAMAASFDDETPSPHRAQSRGARQVVPVGLGGTGVRELRMLLGGNQESESGQDESLN